MLEARWNEGWHLLVPIVRKGKNWRGKIFQPEEDNILRDTQRQVMTNHWLFGRGTGPIAAIMIIKRRHGKE